MTNFCDRVALLGGSFNPVHTGHLRSAIEVAETLHLKRVDLLPSAVPPHKDGQSILPFPLRRQLLEQAIKNEPLLGICDLEYYLPPPSYTWNTAKAWQERYNARPLFIVGDVDFAQFASWHNGLMLPQVTDLVVMPRSGSKTLFIDTVEKYWKEAKINILSEPEGALTAQILAGRCVFLPMPLLQISATELRKKWLSGQSLRYLTPDGVIRMLAEYSEEIHRYWK